jgi:phage tail protein X
MAVDRIYTVRRDGERLDKIARAELGSERGGTLEAILDLNPGLAALGDTPPPGTKIRLPPRPTSTSVTTVPRIWGEEE